MVTLTGTTKDYKGEPLEYRATYEIPVHAEYLGKWETQCIAITKTGEICTVTAYKENPLMGLCARHHRRNVEEGGSHNVVFPR